MSSDRDAFSRKRAPKSAELPSSRTTRSSSSSGSISAVSAAELDRGPDRVSLPERDRAGQAGRRRDDHAVARDLLDSPGRRAEQERLARARLVDHLLVELAHAAAVRQVDAVEAAVGNRAR